jgi:hypothetical protein
MISRHLGKEITWVINKEEETVRYAGDLITLLESSHIDTGHIDTIHGPTRNSRIELCTAFTSAVLYLILFRSVGSCQMVRLQSEDHRERLCSI